jgi:hypothetical protein
MIHQLKRFFIIVLWVALLGGASYSFAAPTLVKSVDNYAPKVLDTYRYHIVYDNVGSSSTTTTITDAVPAGVSVVGMSVGGSLSGGTITWNLGAVSCQTVTLTLNVWGDTSGAWGTAAQVKNNDGTYGTSTTDAFTTYQSNVFYFDTVTGYSMSTVNSMKLTYVWYKPNNGDNVVAKFSNDGDDSTMEGAITLTAGSGKTASVTETWDITGASTWNLSAVQRLHPYIEHQSGGTAQTAYMDQIYAVVAFQSCGKEVWFDAVVTNSHKNGDVVNNSSSVNVNGTSYNSNTVPVTVKGPVLNITKSAMPTNVLPGTTVEYRLHYASQITGLSVFEDFNKNLGTDSGSITANIFPGWSTDHANSGWSNTGGVITNLQNAYYMLYRSDTAKFSDGTVSMDFLLGTGANGNTSIAFLYDPADGKFYKSKLYHDASNNYFVDIQTGPTWLQVCGAAALPGFNPNIWHNFKVVIKNYVFSVYIDNVLVFTCNDPTNYAKRPGWAGIYNDGGAAQFDNYRIGDDVNAVNVRITDTLQSSMVYVSATPVATVSGSLLAWAVSLLSGGQQGDIVYKAAVPAGAAAGSVIPNLAAIAADNAQVSISGNAAVTVIGPFSKTANPTSVAAGGNVTYTLSYQAPGGGVSVKDDFADGVWNDKWLSRNAYNSYWSEGGGAITCTTWGPDAFTAIGSDGVDGTASVTMHQAAGSKQGLVFGYQGGKYYYVTVNTGYGNANDDTVGLYYYNGTASITISELTNQSFEPAASGALPAWVAYKVVRGGNQFFVYYNGTLIGSFVDTSNYLPGAGTQGLYESAAPVMFDNYDWEPNRVGVILTDTLPTSETYVSSSPSAVVTTGPIVWDVADAAPGSYVTVTLVTQISASASSGPVTNCAARQFMTGAVTIACAVVTVSGAVTPTFTPTRTYTPTSTYTATLTRTPTLTPTITFTSTFTPSPTPTRTSTPTWTVTWTSSPTFTSTRTNTSTATPSATLTPTPTNTSTSTPSATPSNTSTSTRTNTATPTPSATYTATPTRTPTATSTNTSTSTPTATATRSNTATFTPTPTATSTATATNTSTQTPTPSPTPSSTSTSTATSTATPTATKTNTATSTSTPTITSTPTATNTGTNPPTNTYTVTNTPTRTATSTATFTATSTPSPTSTSTSTATSTPTPTSTNTSTATNTVTNTSTATATRTSTWTATSTYTSTVTNTATESFTPTVTNTGTNPPTNTFTVTNSPTRTFTSTSTPTFTSTDTATSTTTRTSTDTSTPTSTSTSTNTWTPSNTPTSTSTSTPTQTQTSTWSATGTQVPTDTFTVSDTPTTTWTSTWTSTWTATSTDTTTFTMTSTATSTPTRTNTSTDTATSSSTATESFTPTATQTGTAPFTNTFTATPTLTETFTSTWTPTSTQTWTNTATFTKTETPLFTYTWTFTPTDTATMTSTATPTWTGTETYTPTRTHTFTPTLTSTVTFTTTHTWTATNTSTPTIPASPTVTETVTITSTRTPRPPDEFFVSRNVYRPDYDQPPVFVRVHLSTPGYCSIKIYNSAGEFVKELWNSRVQDGLYREIPWDGKNMHGAPVASGLYVIYYTSRYQTRLARLLVLR